MPTLSTALTGYPPHQNRKGHTMKSKLEELRADAAAANAAYAAAHAAYVAACVAYVDAYAADAAADAAYDAYVTAAAYVTELKRLQGDTQ